MTFPSCVGSEPEALPNLPLEAPAGLLLFMPSLRVETLLEVFGYAVSPNTSSNASPAPLRR